MLADEIIKSIGYDQQQIINDILKLHNHGRSIDLDPCYNVGGFYKDGKVLGPRIKSDINPQAPGVLKLDVRALPFPCSSIQSAIFDPPFICSNPGQSVPYKMSKLYGNFASPGELKQCYYDSLLSLKRVLKHGGLLIFKCQDFVHAGQQHLILPVIINMAQELNYAVRDLFILISKSRILGNIKQQRHARKYHCYFLVLKCNKRKEIK